ncbi:TPA: hypothetical protein JD264_05175 [Serratia fonticola]|nr:hypothetical protein [Serratia fonticola]
MRLLIILILFSFNTFADQIVITRAYQTGQTAYVHWEINNVSDPRMIDWYNIKYGIAITRSGNHDSTTVNAPAYSTVDSATRLFAARFGRSGVFSWYVGGVIIAQFCPSYTLNTGGGDLYRPIGACRSSGYVRPTCSFSGNAYIDHGSIAPKDVAGHVASTSTSVQCDRSASVRISSAPNINLGSGVQSTIRIDGVGQGGSITFPAGTSSRTISSTLQGTPSSTGKISGSSVVIVDYN